MKTDRTEPTSQRPGRTLALRRLPTVLGLLAILALVGLGLADAARSQMRPEGPPPVERTPDAPPWPKDFEIGLEAARAFAYYFGLVRTDSLVSRVTEIGYQVASQAGHPEYLFTFNILDMDDPNALALPGGFIFITKGMLDQGLSDQALAHVIGHEIAHVTSRHFARSEKVESLLSLLQTAVTVAAVIATPESNSGGYDYDETTGQYRLSASGKMAALQGTTIFGGLFRELLVRGYSRGLEVEADQVGRKYAGRAGYQMSGGIELMTKLEERTYENREYGYWTTHPLFEERIIKARAAVDGSVMTPPPAQEVRSYRTEIQARMARLAETIKNDDLALFLFETALRVGPSGPQTVSIARQKLERQVAFERRKPDIFREYTPIAAEYDSLLDAVHAAPQGIAETEIRRITTSRDELVLDRKNIREKARDRVLAPTAGVQTLETYLVNFPEDSLATDLRFRLAEQYRLTKRADRAALELDDLLVESLGSEPPDTTQVTRSLDAIRRTIPDTKELVTNQRLILTTPSDSVRSWATSHLEVLAADLDSLEIGSRFLASYPHSEQADVVQQKVEELANIRYRKARLHESLGNYQEALDGYHAVALLAPSTEASKQARAGIERISARESSSR